jgi:hypothetical protein
MFLAVLASLLIFGGAAWSVLNHATAPDPRRNTVTSAVLLSASAVIGLVAVGAALTGWA